MQAEKLGDDPQDVRRHGADPLARIEAAYADVGRAVLALGDVVKDALVPRDGDTALQIERCIVAFTICLRLAVEVPSPHVGNLSRRLRWFGYNRLPAVLARAFQLGDRTWVEDQFDHGERLWDELVLIQRFLSPPAWQQIERAYGNAAAWLERNCNCRP